jgi:beta-mannosidase
VNSAKVLVLILTLLTLTAATSHSQTNAGRESGIHRISIHTGWQFREAGKDTWHPATVPGSVHTDLLNNKLIEDPFYRDNEQKLQWIGKTNWEYQTTFNVTPKSSSAKAST